MFNIADGRHRFTWQKHALGDRSSREFDTSGERMQVDVGCIGARLASLRHQGPQLVAKFRHGVGVIIVSKGNAVLWSPNETAILPVRIGIDGRAAEWLTEQARTDCMAR